MNARNIFDVADALNEVRLNLLGLLGNIVLPLMTVLTAIKI